LSEIPRVSSPPTLDYGQVSIKRSWGRQIARGTIAMIVLSTGIAVYVYRADISLRIRRIYWFHQCMVHVTPPGTVLVEFDPVKGKALLDSNPDYIDPATYVPAGELRLGLQDPMPTAKYLPRAWRKLEEIEPLPVSILDGDIINFMGERRTPSGRRRLVVIRGAETNANFLVQYMRAPSIVVPPPGLFDKLPRQIFRAALSFSGSFMPAHLAPGVADPADPTHLTIDFTIERRGDNAPQRSGVLDVYLRDDDTLDFKVRDPATTQGL
jgi:hypothetical protein